MNKPVQLSLIQFNSRKAEQYFSQEYLFVRTTTSIIAYWKTVYENAREIRYVVTCLLKFLKVRATNVCVLD